jgi:FKBP-type peptidyl-prolyl cis-trans isomerase
VLLPAARTPWTGLGATATPAMDTGWVQMELSLRGMRSLQQSREQARAALMARTPADEERITADFLAAHTGPWKEALGLRYILDSLADQSPRVQSGDLVTIVYTASFLDNGKVFDELDPADGGLTFRLGDPDQVIKGLEAAVHLLPADGGSGLFLIPSSLAFGPQGSSSGIVPPWTPVLYSVTVVPQPAG